MSTCKHCGHYRNGFCDWLAEQAREGVIAVGVDLPKSCLEQIRVPVPPEFCCDEILDHSPAAQAEALRDAEAEERRRAGPPCLSPPPASLHTHK